jgi:hypothetical protein
MKLFEIPSEIFMEHIFPYLMSDVRNILRFEIVSKNSKSLVEDFLSNRVKYFGHKTLNNKKGMIYLLSIMKYTDKLARNEFETKYF